METDVIELEQLARPKRPTFGEFLVAERVLDRFQLLRSLQLKDRLPNARVGQCAVALGYAPRTAIETLHDRFARLTSGVSIDIEDRVTETFDRDSIDITFD
jgi:hypothetical protein